MLATDGPQAGHLDGGKLAAAGHLEGALTTVGLFSTCRDDRLKAGVILSGDSVGFESAMSGPPAPLLFAHGDQDHLTPIALDRHTFPWPKAFLTLRGEGHTDPYLKESDPSFAIAAAVTTD
ncbi:MAG TPA: alpha/beta hydrolase, partial [Candidatus Dormibacteraeota bacterium]|nr:alpha/beta hydrolase [Candidatus Dormibacteraeota bacterium]